MSEERKDVWPPGIPKYTDDDLLEGEELLKFGMQVVYDYEITKNGHKMIAANTNPDQIPNFVVEINGQLSFIQVKVDIYPKDAVLTRREKNNLIAHATKYGAKPYFAPVGLMPTDPARMQARLALKFDGFYIKYVELEEVKEDDPDKWIKDAMKELKTLDLESQIYKVEGDIPVARNEDSMSDFEKWKSELYEPTFSEMLMECIDRKQLSNQQFYKAAFLDRKLFSAIKNNPEYKPKKETAVACCLGLELNVYDAEKLLELAGYTLSTSIGWDRVILYCLKAGIHDLDKVNDLLYEEGEKCIRV